jgi:RimJ/RimL family protein N-acetyltransferase
VAKVSIIGYSCDWKTMKTTRPVFSNPLPTFTSDRLLFREIRASDADDYHAFRTDFDLMKWTSAAKCDVDIEATRVWMARFMPPNDTETFSFSIEEKMSPGKVIGSIGVHEMHPPEFGYFLAQSSWGKGYATEAVHAFLAVYWELERKTVEVDDKEAGVESERLNAVADADNKASRNVLVKCGFTFAGLGDEDGRPDARYYLEAPEA